MERVQEGDPYSSSLSKQIHPAATPALTPEERYRQVAEAAYYIAEKRGFAPGNPSDDWYQAEAEVDGKTA